MGIAGSHVVRAEPACRSAPGASRSATCSARGCPAWANDIVFDGRHGLRMPVRLERLFRRAADPHDVDRHPRQLFCEAECNARRVAMDLRRSVELDPASPRSVDLGPSPPAISCGRRLRNAQCFTGKRKTAGIANGISHYTRHKNAWKTVLYQLQLKASSNQPPYCCTAR